MSNGKKVPSLYGIAYRTAGGDSYVVMGVHDFARFQREHGQFERRHDVWNEGCPFLLCFVGADRIHVRGGGVCVHEHRPPVGAFLPLQVERGLASVILMALGGWAIYNVYKPKGDGSEFSMEPDEAGGLTVSAALFKY